jgi:pimeloyl-ACP methyl ester carboxylesterase
MPKSAFLSTSCSKSDFIKLVKSMEKLDFSNRFNEIDVKTLIICGERDKVNLKSATLLKKAIKNSQSIIVKNSGHEVNIDEPKQLLNIIESYWK